MKSAAARRGVLPGYRLTLGVTTTWLSLLVLLPLGALVWKTTRLEWSRFVEVVTAPRALAALRLSFGAALAAALADGALGLLVAWVLARYRFPGRAALDALVDLPFALPTAVAGVALCTLLGPTGVIGRLVAHKIAFARPGVVIALAFVGLPFVVRAVQPVLAELDPAVEEAAAVLGASRLRTFVRVLLPAFAPALTAGIGLAFARALGEYGSIVFVSGNLPLQTEIAPVLIVAELEQYDYTAATSIAVVLLGGSFVLLYGFNRLARALSRGARS